MKKKDLFFYILVGFSFLIISYLLTHKVFQNDTYYTIKVGESIFKNGIDMKDHFSFISDLTYSYPHWLYDSFIYFLYSIGGFNLIYISTILLGFTLLITTYIFSIKLGNNKYVSYLLIMFFSFFLSGYFTARAQMFSYIAFVVIIYSIDMLRKTEKKRYIIYLFLSTLLIANAHAAVWLFSLILFLPFIVQDIIYLITKKFNLTFIKSFNFEIEKSKLKLTLIAFGLCVLTGFLTPNFLVPFTYYINTVSGVSMNYISEHGVVNIDYAPYVYILILVTIILLLNKKIKVKLWELFLLTGLFILAFLSIKNIALLFILSMLVYSRLFSLFDYSSVEPYVWNKYFISFLLVFFAFAFLISYQKNSKKEFVDESSYPVSASEFIINNLDYENARIYNQYDFGSYLLFKKIPVYIDSRADLYLKEFNKDCLVFEDYFDAKNNNNYRSVFNKYDITHVLLRNNTSLYRTISNRENYKILYQDDYFTLYELGD